MALAYLFDTDALSELFRPKPATAYVEWLTGLDREQQFTSSVVIGELLKGAHKSPARDRHLGNIEQRVLPAVTVLPYDVAVARVFGRISAELEQAGTRLADADLQIAATAIHHDLKLVTGNLRHFERVPGLGLSSVFANSRG